MKTPLTALFDLLTPLIQAPMAGVSTPEMASEVTNSGGLGCVALGAANVDAAEAAWSQALRNSSGPLVANVFCHPAPVHDQALEAAWLGALEPLFARFDATPPAVLREIYQPFSSKHPTFSLLLDRKPAGLSCHFGVPDRHTLRLIRAHGIKTLASATTLDEARILQDAGIDLIIAQGIEAGGHSGAFDLRHPSAAMATLNLVRTLTHSIDTPVVAAGGLVSGDDIRAVIQAGAVGAQLGTVFIATREATADALYRQNLAQSAPTHRTANISGRMARGFVSPLMSELDQLLVAAPAYPFTYDATKQLVDAARAWGVSDFGVMWAGTGEVQHGLERCADVIRMLTAQLDI